jgi:ABC-type uncharacterized transport system involved in gliding motility auxiliary subunit
MGMNLDRSRLAPYTYLVGLFFLVAAGVRYILTRQFDTTFQVTLGLFVLGIAGGILLDPGRVRRLLSGRQARYGSNALLVSLAVLGIIGVVNYLIYQNPKSWDLTEDQQYSLAPETVKILDELDQPVQLKGFYTPSLSGARDNIRPLLEQYQVNSGGKLTFEFIDPDKNPAAVRQYGVTKDASIVVVMGDQTTVVQPVSEQDLTSALIRLANPGNRVVYFLTGHGEHDTASSTDTGYSQVAASLKAKNYTVTALNLLQSGKVPEDAQAVVIAGPQLALSSDEVKMLQDYQAGGGSLVVLYEPSVSIKISATDDPLQSYLEQTWGISFQDDLIVQLCQPPDHPTAPGPNDLLPDRPQPGDHHGQRRIAVGDRAGQHQPGRLGGNEHSNGCRFESSPIRRRFRLPGSIGRGGGGTRFKQRFTARRVRRLRFRRQQLLL